MPQPSPCAFSPIRPAILSSGLVTARTVRVATLAYSAVLSSLAWPSRTWMTRMSTPSSSRWVANPRAVDPGGMRADALGEPCRLGGLLHDPAQLTGADRPDRVLTWEQPALRQHRALAPAFPPPRPEQGEEVGREHRIAVTTALAALDADQHPLAVDVDHLERRHFGNPQPGAISHAQCGAVLEAGCRREQPGDLLGAERRWRLAGIGRTEQLARQVRPIHRGGEEEPQTRDMAVHRRRRHPGLALLDLAPPNVLGRGAIRGSSEESGETRNDADVVALGLLAKPAQGHVFDEALTQIADASRRKRLVHGPLLSGGKEPSWSKPAGALKKASGTPGT